MFGPRWIHRSAVRFERSSPIPLTELAGSIFLPK